MRKLTIKAWRDIKRMKLRGLGIVIATAFWVSFYGGYYMGVESGAYSARRIFQDLGLADLQVFIPPSTAEEIPGFDDLPGIEFVQKRLFDYGTVELKDGGLLPVYIIYEEAINGTPVNNLKLLEGEMLGHVARGGMEREILVDRTVADIHGFTVGDSIYLTSHGIEETARIKGVALTPEFLYPSVDPNLLMPATGSLGIVFGLMQKVEDLFGYPLYNSLSFRFAPSFPKEEITNLVLERLAGLGVEAALPKEESPDQKIIQGFYRNGYEFAPVALTVIGIGIFVIIGIYIYRMVEERRSDIGILLALGERKPSIMAYVLRMVFSFVLAGCTLGYPLSFLMNRALTVAFAKPLNLPSHSFLFLPVLPLEAVGICLLVCLILVGGVCLSLWRLHPQEAIRGKYPSPRRFSFPFLSGANRTRNLFVQYALRGLWRRRKLTVVTVLSVSFALAFSASFNILVTSLGDTVKGYYEKDPWHLTASLRVPLKMKDIEEKVPMDAVDMVEGFLTGYGYLEIGGTRAFGKLVGLHENSFMKILPLVDGRGFSEDRADEIILNRNHWRENPLRVGQEIIVGTSQQERTLVLVGLVDEMTIGAKYGYLPIRTAQEMLDLDDKFTGIWLTADSSTESVWKSLNQSGLITQVISKGEFNEVLDRYLWELRTGLRAVVTITMFLAPFFLFAGINLWMLENEYDFVMFRVMGFLKRTLSSIVFVQALTIGFLGALFSLPLAFLAGRYLVYKNTKIYLYNTPLSFDVSDFYYTGLCLLLLPGLAWLFSGKIMRINIIEKLTRKPS